MERNEALELVEKSLKGFSSDAKKAWESEASGMPLLEGETYHFGKIDQDSIVPGTVNGNRFNSIKTKEGTLVGFSHIARLNNGLGLKSSTRKELVAEFIENVNNYVDENPDSEGYPVKVARLRTRPSSFGLQVLPTFEV